jgi:hypothetical protein
MNIDLNDPQALTIANVRAFLASGRTNIELEIRVTLEGNVFLSDVIGQRHMDGILFRITDMMIDPADAEFIGPNAAAASNDGLVRQVLDTLEKNWKHKPSRPSVDLEPYSYE